MSDFRAIGGVSVTLKALLEDRMELPTGLPGLPASLSTPVVTISTPPSEENGVDTTKSWINLFLYRVTENGHLKNQEIPGQGLPGAYGHPPLSLDLHYVLTAYGSTNGQNELPGDERVAHYLLGSAMRVLHDHPVITKQLRTVKSPAGEQILDQSLTEEFEQVKLYLDPISLEDLSKVWTSLMLSYRLSVAYKVTVVQIESQRLRRFPKPVGEPTSAGPRVYAVPFQSPQIQELRVRRGDPSSAESPFPYARVGDILVIRGRNFGNKPVKVLLGGLEVPVTPQSDDRIELVIPDTKIVLDKNPPDGPEIPEERRLQSGAQPVSVVLGVPELPQTGFRSNQAVFMLVPLIASPVPPNQNLPSLEPNLNAVPRTLKVRGKRLFLGTLSGETLVGPVLIGKNSYRNPSPTEITVSLPDTLPARLVQTLISEGLSFPTNLPNQLEIRVKFGTEAPRTTTLTKKPTTLEDAADILQAAVRSTPGGGIAFKGARVTTAGDRLVVVPGGLFFDPVTISGTRMADQLKLSTGRQVKGAYLSGELTPFPVLTAAQPSLGVSIGGPLRTVTLTSRPTTLADAADILQAAIRTAGTSLGPAEPDKDAFSGARVTVLGGQLLILPGSSRQVNFRGVPDSDQTSVAELQLRTRYPVRVRVNGAESIDDKGVEIPERVP